MTYSPLRLSHRRVINERIPPQQQGEFEAKISPQRKGTQKPRASSMSTKSPGTVSDILMLKGEAVGAGSGGRRLGLSNKVRIVPLHARLKTPPPSAIYKTTAKPKRKKDDSDVDSEEEYEGLTEAQIAKKRDEKRKAAWYSP